MVWCGVVGMTYSTPFSSPELEEHWRRNCGPLKEAGGEVGGSSMMKDFDSLCLTG